MRSDILSFVRELTTTDTKSLTEKVAKLFEEGGELAGKALPYDRAAGTLHRVIRKEEILEEVADVILVALSVAYSLDYEDDDIASMMQRKSLIWSQLQDNEVGVDPNKIPFEIHVTVEQAVSPEKFREDCHTIGVKPVMLDLQTKAGGVIKDVMTSSVVIGSTSTAFNEMYGIETRLSDMGYKVVRGKIETSPRHPSVPTDANKFQHAPGRYFESHIEILVKDQAHYEVLRSNLRDSLPWVHLSRNAFKRKDSGAFTVMATVRKYDQTLEHFKGVVAITRGFLEEWRFELPSKDIIEYSIYDSKVHHDAEWTA
jgi:NTP pyrophosphatase (non-canonical NTP hydrolase)